MQILGRPEMNRLPEICKFHTNFRQPGWGHKGIKVQQTGEVANAVVDQKKVERILIIHRRIVFWWF